MVRLITIGASVLAGGVSGGLCVTAFHYADRGKWGRACACIAAALIFIVGEVQAISWAAPTLEHAPARLDIVGQQLADATHFFAKSVEHRL